ncbi:MAG TPA: SurA N-terminal domain-containing protein [Terracidiphilus sp.]|nr:SurA N-terminal domain-containing protein [Terracidiphilus sp.]
MSVEVRSFSRRGFAVLVVSSGLVLSSVALGGIAGCRHSPSSDVMATVNGKEITKAELDRAYKNYIMSMGQTSQQSTPEETDILRLRILHQMIEDEVLQQRAAKLNLAATDEDVNARLTEMKAPYTEEEFARQLKARDLTLDDLKTQIRRSLTQDKLENKEIYSKINITDADISNYYKAHKAEFSLIEPQYNLAQVVASTIPPSKSDNSMASDRVYNDATAHKRIQTVLNRLDSGEDFGTVAMTSSDNSANASNGGNMGFIGESALKTDPEAYDAISKLKPGQITGVLPMYDGAGPGRHVIAYAVFKLLSKEPAGQRELNDPNVQQVIRQSLREARAQLLKNAYFEVLHDQAKIRNYYAERILKNGA